MDDQPADHRRPDAVQQGAEGTQFVPRGVGDPQGDLQPGVQGGCLLGGTNEGSFDIRRVETYFGPQVGQAQGLEAGDLGGGQRFVVAGDFQPQTWQRTRLVAQGKGQLDSFRGGRRGWNVPAQPDRDPLADARARFDRDREGQAQRRAVGLERGVGPVALVLHLEGVAFHQDFGLHAGHHAVGERPDVEEGLMGGDALRKSAVGHAAIDVRHRAWGARQGHRVQDAEADPVALEAGARFAVEGEDDRAVGGAGDAALPEEVDVGLAVGDVVADREGVGPGFDLDVGKLGADGAPVVVTDGGVDPAHDLVLAEPDVAQVAVIVQRRERPRAERDRFRQRFVLAVIQHALRHFSHHRLSLHNFSSDRPVTVRAIARPGPSYRCLLYIVYNLRAPSTGCMSSFQCASDTSPVEGTAGPSLAAFRIWLRCRSAPAA